MKKITFAFLLVAFNLGHAEVPSWVNDASLECTKGNMCAVGSGTGLNDASTQARLELSKIFESKIKETFQSLESLSGEKSYRDISEEINTSTESILNAVTIKKTSSTKDEIFALAELDVPAASKLISEKIVALDTEIASLMKKKTRMNGEKIYRIYNARTAHHSNYFIMTGKVIKCPITYEEVIKMRSLKSTGLPIHVSINGGAYKDFKNSFTAKLVSYGYQLANDNEENYRYISLKISAQDEHFNVEGFKKKTYTLTVMALNGRKIIGKVVKTMTKTGRSDEQLQSAAIAEFTDQIEDILIELDLE